MNTELKQRKTVTHRKRAKPTENACPEEVTSFNLESRSNDLDADIFFTHMTDAVCIVQTRTSYFSQHVFRILHALSI